VNQSIYVRAIQRSNAKYILTIDATVFVLFLLLMDDVEGFGKTILIGVVLAMPLHVIER
jgi:hypothetical protein